MNREEHYQLRQIRVKQHVYMTIRHYCLLQRQTMTAFYSEAMEWFIRQGAANDNITYLASVKNGKIVSLWLSNTHIDFVHNRATSACVSDARVIHTAIAEYIKNIEILKI
jgi:hypothetical protein